jgi:hypothetical protein
VTHARIAGRPARVRSLHSPSFAPARKAPVKGPAVYWPAVAVAAGAGALLMVGATVGLARFAARTPKPVQVAEVAPAQAYTDDASFFSPMDLTVPMLQQTAPAEPPQAPRRRPPTAPPSPCRCKTKLRLNRQGT